MRIVHTCLRYPPATGGVETYVQEIIERTRNIDDGRDVRVLTSKMRTHGPVTLLLPESLRDDPPYVQRLHHATTPLISYPRLQALPYYLGHHRPDIVEAYSFWYQPADAAARYAQRNKIPFIFHPIFYANEIRRKKIWQLYKKTIGHRTFAAAAVVVVISPQEQKLIEQAGLPAKRFALVPPGVDLAELSHPPASQRIFAPGASPIIITVSRLASGKGIEEVIISFPAILKIFPAAYLLIIGEDFGEEYNLRALARKQGVDRKIVFTGKLSRTDLVAAYRQADLLIHPSYYEAFGIVLAEAMAAQTPVVARNIASIPYIMDNGLAGLLFNNQDEMIKNIIQILSSQNLSMQLTTHAYQYVTQNFNWDQSIKKLVDIYEELQSDNQAKSSR